MLPASARVRSRSEHRLVAARGRRARRGPIVVHLLAASSSAGSARAGVIVGKSVGSAARRNLVKRRLREQLRVRLPALPDGFLVVVRALPGAAELGFDHLGSALDSALGALGVLPEAVGARARTAPRGVGTVGRGADMSPRGGDTARSRVDAGRHGTDTVDLGGGTVGRGPA